MSNWNQPGSNHERDNIEQAFAQAEKNTLMWRESSLGWEKKHDELAAKLKRVDIMLKFWSKQTRHAELHDAIRAALADKEPTK